MSRLPRTFKVEPALGDMLGLSLQHSLAEKVDEWKEQVAAGEIGEQARAVFQALGWITPRDVRVQIVPLTAQLRVPKSTKAKDEPQEAAAEEVSA